MIDYSHKYVDEHVPDSFKKELDVLFESVKSYRTSKHFKSILDVCSRFKHLAPFNSLMVEMQRPGCNMVLTSSQWKKRFNRRILPNARPVVILSFQPVSYLFDLSDTEPIDEASTPTQKILEDIRKEYDTKQSISKNDLDLLIHNLPVVGIAYSDIFRAGNDYSARIELLPNSRKIEVPVNKSTCINYNAKYLISVNETSSISARFTGILHELGHLYCHHLIAPREYKGWKVRNLTHAEKEFEAESVAWITCERLNISNPSEQYLSWYLDEYNDIPDNISVDHIFKAHNEIWKLLFQRQNATNNFLFNQDEVFRERVKGITSHKKHY